MLQLILKWEIYTIYVVTLKIPNNWPLSVLRYRNLTNPPLPNITAKACSTCTPGSFSVHTSEIKQPTLYQIWEYEQTIFELEGKSDRVPSVAEICWRANSLKRSNTYAFLMPFSYLNYFSLRMNNNSTYSGQMTS